MLKHQFIQYWPLAREHDQLGGIDMVSGADAIQCLCHHFSEFRLPFVITICEPGSVATIYLLFNRGEFLRN